jgi:DNA-binding phage protein
MFQDLILEYLKSQNIKMTELCEATGINRQNAYKAMKWSNLENPTLIKMLEYLDLEISISLIKKHGKIQKTLSTPEL